MIHDILQNDYSIKLTHPSPHIATVFVCALRAFKTHSFSNFQMCSASLVAQLVKNLPAMRGDLGLTPGLGVSPGEGQGYPLQYSGLENSMDCLAHGVAKSWTRLSDFHFVNINLISTL